jgi:uncharacterized protein (TIGR03086 family)
VYPISGADIRELDARAVRASVAVVSQVTSRHLHHPTPCAEWLLGDLLAHMTAQHHGFAAAAAGRGADLAAWRTRPLGDDPAARYEAAAAGVVAAFADDAVLEREFSLPEFTTRQTFPARRAIGFHFLDYVVHAWDVASSLDLTVDVDPEVLGTALAMAREIPDGESRLLPGAAFRPAVTAPPDAGLLDLVVALLGRSPAWRAGGRGN